MHHEVGLMLNGADNRDRTDDLRFTRALLYQLSYVGLLINWNKTIFAPRFQGRVLPLGRRVGSKAWARLVT